MEIWEEKRLIYELMKKVIEERRELSKSYFDLKKQLNSLNEQESRLSSGPKIPGHNLTEMPVNQHVEKRKLYEESIITKRQRGNYPFERVAGYVIEMLREEGIPLNTKQIHGRLENDYGIYIGYANLKNNILRKMIDLDKFSIEKATRGFYQYRKRGN